MLPASLMMAMFLSPSWKAWRSAFLAFSALPSLCFLYLTLWGEQVYWL